MKYSSMILAAIAIWIVDGIIMFLTCGWLFKWVYMLPPHIWKEPISWSVFALIPSILKAFFFVFVYAVFYNGIPSTGAKKGMVYGFLLWIATAAPALAAFPIFMTISTGVVTYWILQALVIGLINGAITGIIYKPLK